MAAPKCATSWVNSPTTGAGCEHDQRLGDPLACQRLQVGPVQRAGQPVDEGRSGFGAVPV